ncbi:MAG: hypothetical protein ABI767_14780 [Rhodanobacter sp.]
MTHDGIIALSAIVDGSRAISVSQVLFWLALSLTVLGIAMLLRWIARGHVVRDLRSLRIGMALLALAVPLWIGSRMAPPPPADMSASSAQAMVQSQSPPAVQALIERHCYACHASQSGSITAPWRLKLDQPGAVDRLSSRIYRQVVQLRAMPMGNATHMTDQDRQVIARWYQARPRPRTHADKPH